MSKGSLQQAQLRRPYREFKFTMDKAYAALQQEAGTGWFAKMAPEQFAWALEQARAGDARDRRGCLAGNYPDVGDFLLQMARENVRDFARAWKPNVAK